MQVLKTVSVLLPVLSGALAAGGDGPYSNYQAKIKTCVRPQFG